MGTSNSKPQQSPATDSPLGAPGGNEPYKTKRARNWANPENTGDMTDATPNSDGGKEAEDLNDDSAPIGNVATDSNTKPEPKPAKEG